VYSLLGGMLVHRVASVEAQWYRPEYDRLVRLDTPSLTIRAVCGQVFYGNCEKARAQACAVPRADAVACGRCNGEGPVFGRGLRERTVLRREAKARIGCALEVA
jgi:hypothetical protein